MSSAALGGEFVDVHRFNLSGENHDCGWREVSDFFSPSRSKTWRLVIESYYKPAGGSHQGPDLYYAGFDVILREPEIGLGETSVLNGMILLVSAHLCNKRGLSSRSRCPREKHEATSSVSFMDALSGLNNPRAFFLGAFSQHRAIQLVP